MKRFECMLCGCVWEDEDDTEYRKCQWCGFKEEKELNCDIKETIRDLP